MESKKCVVCGKEINAEIKGGSCSACREKLAKQRYEDGKKKTLQTNEKRFGDTGVLPGASARILGKRKCFKCGHAFRYDTSRDVACGYIVDKDGYHLPPRPFPPALPNQCLYCSPSPSRAGVFTEEEKKELYDPNEKPVIYIPDCKVFKNVKAASEATGVAPREIKKTCRSSEYINANRDWRYLTSEEILLIKPAEYRSTK